MATTKNTKVAAKVSKGTSKSKGTKGTKTASPSPKPATKVAKVAAKVAKPNATNPYRPGGGYHASVEALRSLGVNKLHPLPKVVAAVKTAMGAAGWKAFAAKGKRNDNGKDADARAAQNVAVVARKDYGLPLRKLGWEVRFDGRKKLAGLYKLGK